jgi:protein-S-isoprenylcysteine O-methyltransferase Ste14
MVTSLVYPSALYALVLTVSYWSWIAIELWLIVREYGDPSADSRDRGSRVLLIASWFIGIALGIFTIPYALPQFTMQDNLDRSVVPFGVVLIWAGIAFRLWAIRTLGPFFSTRVVLQRQHRLITSGPYKYIRNPSYTGSMMTFLGFGIAIGNWMSLLTLLVFGCVPYLFRMAVEDEALAAQFGQAYADYRDKTWFLIPFIW